MIVKLLTEHHLELRMRRLVCACVVRKPPKDRVSRVEAHIIAVFMIRAIVNEL